jgi:hypothetical protein
MVFCAAMKPQGRIPPCRFGHEELCEHEQQPGIFFLATIVHNHSLVENVGRVGLNFHF